MFGGDQLYQPWNVIGHLIPGLFLVWLTPKKVELFVAGALISSVVMDSPLWGTVRIDVHVLPLWHIDNSQDSESFSNTCDIHEWIQFYYNPVGTYGVWDINSSIPSAALIFWSLVLRSLGAGLLIWWQARQEEQGKEFSLPKLVLRIGKRYWSATRFLLVLSRSGIYNWYGGILTLQNLCERWFQTVVNLKLQNIRNKNSSLFCFNLNKIFSSSWHIT